MAKFCTNCGKELKEEQDVCLNCGKAVANMQPSEEVKPEEKKDKNHNTFKMVTGIIMIVLGFCLVAASGSLDYYDSPLLVFTIPGLLGLISGILAINSKKNNSLLLPAAILLFAGALINIVAIRDISIFAILGIVFGIFYIKYSKED